MQGVWEDLQVVFQFGTAHEEPRQRLGWNGTGVGSGGRAPHCSPQGSVLKTRLNVED